MSDGISFWVSGTPMQKGSTTRMPNGAYLPAGTAHTRDKMAQWRADVRQAAMQAMSDSVIWRDTGIRLMVEFALMPPRNIPAAKRGWLPHTKRPDIDKLFRALSDALTGVVWVDDSQICVSAINKVYAWDGRSGANISISPISDSDAKHMAKLTANLREFVSNDGTQTPDSGSHAPERIPFGSSTGKILRRS